MYVIVNQPFPVIPFTILKTLRVSGAFTLRIKSVYFLEDTISQFQLDASSMSSVLEPDESTAFTIKFKPKSPDISSATVIIKSNDPDETPYTFTITGTGVVVGTTHP